MFQRVGAAAYKADLSNTLALCKVLGQPEQKFRSIHIAGTNGKGSTSHMLAAILQVAGYKTGLYTSPHLKDFRERIRINGKKISQRYVVDFVDRYKNEFEKIDLSFFEWTVGLAFQYFAEQEVDIAVIETGLGGRLDSTNVIQPLASIITNISWDHANLLGNTLRKIAGEKAGIIKQGIPVVIGETQDQVKTVFTTRAKQLHAPLHFADAERQVRKLRHNHQTPLQLIVDIKHNGQQELKDLRCGLPGLYQQKNIVTVLAAVDELRKKGFTITSKHIRQGLAKVVELTGLQGRWQILSKNPLTIADTGHNEAGIAEIIKQLRHTSYKQLHIVLGMVNDKDPDTILRLFPKKAIYYFCAARLPRALDRHVLAEKAISYGLKGQVCSSVRKALKTAQKAAKSGDLVFIGGSTFVVAEAL